jgi:hypothetical protein
MLIRAKQSEARRFTHIECTVQRKPEGPKLAPPMLHHAYLYKEQGQAA